MVTPFKAQRELIESLLLEAKLGAEVRVGVVHVFQGDERDVMIFSPVVATGMTDGAAKWVEEPPNLINVAVTRARDAFYLVADFRSCERHPGLLGKLVKYVQKVERIRSSSPAELAFYSSMVAANLDPDHHRYVADMEVDFVLEGGGPLASEIDGKTHLSTQGHDAARNAALEARGFTVKRFLARDVFEKPATILKEVQEALASSD